ncbi:MAG: CBS domain-containing protein [Cyanobacteria bacterium NC_groundwater_1444_Ag_S-0.65um_54_12]|nr:CBS domain-containing protein [Cyanobacteria bacterium NC_groundwater_1444_Ag_S-0.65um_54_12]
MLVREIMNEEVITCPPSARIADVARTMKQHNVGMVPITENGQLLGVVTDRDITVYCVATGNIDRSARELIHGRPVTITPDSPVEEAAKVMTVNKVRRLCVTSNGKIHGVLSLDDLSGAGNANLVAEALQQIHQAQCLKH